MSLPDFSQFEPLNELKKKMGIPPDVYGSFPQISPETPPAAAPRPRAYVLLRPSGRRLDLLDPQPDAWTDEDLAVGLSRTYRWSGSSKWDLPLSVAHHSLTVLALREAEGPLTARESMRELLHDATEFMIGWDCLAPLKPQLGPEFARLDRRLQLAVDQRYQLPAWTEESPHAPQARRPARSGERGVPRRRVEPSRDARQPWDHSRSYRQRSFDASARH